MRGIEPDEEEKVIPKLKDFVKYGSKELEGDSVWLGIDLARKLRIGIGDKLTVYSPGNLSEILDGMKELEKAKGEAEHEAVDKLREVVLPKELTVTGIFQTGHYMHDSEFLLVPIHIGQELYGLGDTLHGITVRTADPYGAEAVKKEIQKFLQPPQYAQTWIDMNNQFFEAVRLERTVMFFLLFFIILVAAFGIMNTLITVTVQKTRDIGVMKAIGANITQIVGVFLGQGIIVGLFGTLMGLALGMTAVQYRNEFSDWLASATGIEVFPRQVYNFSRLPAEVIPRDVAIICIGAFLICCIFAFLPAYRAARLDPVKALRYE
jgi:lipoprotein-releasing system permease protein